ncbi:MAG: glycosyltransferase [Gaiellaceae bacterium]
MPNRFTDSVDAVYMLLFPGWESSMRGNRWHWAKRWGLRKPTTLVIPDSERPFARPNVRREERLDGVRILHVQYREDPQLDVDVGLQQAAQICADMEDCRYSRPLLWAYDPTLAVACGAVPASARVFHATENFFAYDGLQKDFIPQLQASIAQADLVVAVSEGVAGGLRANTVPAALAVVTNGVDNDDYAPTEPDPELSALAAGRPVAIYAGNVNRRVDFELVHEAVHRLPETLFVFYGRTWFPPGVSDRAWKNIVAHDNVFFAGEVAPERLPALYSAAEVGLIPYTDDPLLVENGFPLKALEMAATGLPVVSTYMKPIVGLASAIDVVRTHDEFLDALESRSRSALTEDERAELRSACERNDYDVKFEDALAALDAAVAADAFPSTRLDPALAIAGGRWSHRLARSVPADGRSRQPAPLRPRSLQPFARRLRQRFGAR